MRVYEGGGIIMGPGFLLMYHCPPAASSISSTVGGPSMGVACHRSGSYGVVGISPECAGLVICIGIGQINGNRVLCAIARGPSPDMLDQSPPPDSIGRVI